MYRFAHWSDIPMTQEMLDDCVPTEKGEKMPRFAGVELHGGEMLIRALAESAKKWGYDEDQAKDARVVTRSHGRYKANLKQLTSYVKEMETEFDRQTARIRDLQVQLEGCRDNRLQQSNLGSIAPSALVPPQMGDIQGSGPKL